MKAFNVNSYYKDIKHEQDVRVKYDLTSYFDVYSHFNVLFKKGILINPNYGLPYVIILTEKTNILYLNHD